MTAWLLVLFFAAPAAAADYEPQADEGGDEAPEPKADGGEHGAEWDGEDREGTYPRRRGHKNRCKAYKNEADDARRERLRRVDYASGHLGGEHTRRAWKDLVKLGFEGCEAVATWLAQGAPGGDGADRVDASLTLIRSGRDAEVAVGARDLANPDPGRAAAIATALMYRHVALDGPTSQLLTEAYEASDSKIPHSTLVGIFTGTYYIQRTYTVYTYINGQSVPQTRTEITWYFAEGEPPPGHVEAMRAWLDNATDKERRFAVERIRRRILFDAGIDSTRWTPVLLELTRDPDEGVIDTAAHALGWMQPPESRDIADTLMDRGDYIAEMAFAKGLRSRLKARKGDAESIRLLNHLRQSSHPQVAKKAKAWAKKLAGKVRE